MEALPLDSSQGSSFIKASDCVDSVWQTDPGKCSSGLVEGRDALPLACFWVVSLTGAEWRALCASEAADRVQFVIRANSERELISATAHGRDRHEFVRFQNIDD